MFAEVFVTLLVIMDPVGNVPVFLALTRDLRPEERSRAALLAAVMAALVILVFAFFGRELLALLGVSVEALQVSGGLLLGLVALELLRGGGTPRTGPAAPNVAFVPLGTPLLAGPGAIAATMVFAGRAQEAGETLVVVGALVAVVVVVYLALRFAHLVRRLLRDNGIELVTRIMGLLLAAIAVQLVAVGVEAWVEGGVTG